MESTFSVDLISDLNVTKSEEFDWSGKPTSLFCIVAGNISDDIDTIKYVLEHLGSLYRGVFYIDGTLEHTCLENFTSTVSKISDICQAIPNVVYMHNHVVVLNGIAFVAANCWYRNSANIQNFDDQQIVDGLRRDDLGYLSQTLRNLQNHKDLSKIIVVTASLPSEHFIYTKSGQNLRYASLEPGMSLVMDRGQKVTHWLYSGTEIVNDCVYNNRRFVNNPPMKNCPYWPKRIMV